VMLVVYTMNSVLSERVAERWELPFLLTKG